jgi:hypothetical protein
VLQCPDGSYCCDGNRSFDCCTQSGAESFSLTSGSIVGSITQAGQTFAPTSLPATVLSPFDTTRSSVAMDNSPQSTSLSSGDSNAGKSSTISVTSTSSSAPSTSSMESSHSHVSNWNWGNSTWHSHSSESQKLGLEIGLSVGAVMGVLLMLFLHFIYRCWKRQHREQRQQQALLPYGQRDIGYSRQGRTSWISTWRRRISGHVPTASEPASQVPTLENVFSELPVEEVSIIPGRLELPHQNTNLLTAQSQCGQPGEQPLSPVSELDAGNTSDRSANRLSNSHSPMSSTFRQQEQGITNSVAPHGSNAEWSDYQSPTLVELPGESIPELPAAYIMGKKT